MRNSRYQHGAVLIVSLIFLMVMTLFGVTAMQGTTQNERMSNNASQRSKAFEAAEAGLRDAEMYISLNVTDSTPFDDSTITGLCTVKTPAPDIASYWGDIYDWEDTIGGANAGSRLYMEDDAQELDESLSSQPRYVIERVRPVGVIKGDDLEATKPRKSSKSLYRITVRSTGNTSDAVVILQSTYIF